MKLKYYISKFALALVFLVMNMWTYAQPPGGPPPGGGGGGAGTTPPCWEPSCIPIDSGILFLIAAGVLLAIRKLYTFKTA